ncbi:N-6 DNA methylase [Virgibacillus sp. LDC-1]|uniref:N-6 DNA methylase n=1 Tax=Virgibacillus sp. LDC-1 TaxID=3039856 RepID=UPI0024DE9881|nr:N-6 DNA methylase [Virgibacillus sp. LDC-1]
MLNKQRLISDLKISHKQIVDVYKKIFNYKFENESTFHKLINQEYKKANVSRKGEKQSWNEQYIHRSAYTLLNKILFIRICEDKGFMLNEEDRVMGEALDSTVGQKLSMIGLQKWSGLISNYTLSELVRFAFKDMNRSYRNIPLYKEDIYDWLIPNKSEIELKFFDSKLYEKMSLNDFESVLEKLIETLDITRYDFGGSSENVLGDVYEKFMDRETRKELGQFYTPDFVIRYILKNTISKVNVLEKPFVKVLDPSCGSGHFLIMAYDILRGKFEEKLHLLREKFSDHTYEIINNNERVYVKGHKYWTSKYLHYHILKNCIYGADIDPFALQITTINLLLKDLDNYITDDLNILECDSLIKWEEDYDLEGIQQQLSQEHSIFINNKYTNIKGELIQEEIGVIEAEEIIKKCTFWDTRFDYIVGNPPYGSKLSGELKDYYKRKYSEVHMRTIDIYNFFVKRFLDHTDQEYGLIIPDSILTQYEFTKTREYILNESNLKYVVKMGEGVFDDNSYPTAILLGSKVNTEKESNEVILLDVSKAQNNIKKSEELYNPIYKYQISQNKINKLENSRFLFADKSMIDLILAIRGNNSKLMEYTDNISRGITTGKDKAYLMNYQRAQNFTTNQSIIKPVLVGGDLELYKTNFNDKYIPYITRKTEKSSEKESGELIAFLDRFNEPSKITKDTTLSNFKLHRPREEEMFLQKKVLCRQTGDKLICAIDNEAYYNLDSVLNIVLNEKGKQEISEEFVAALLNSKLCNVYYTILVQEGDRAFAQVKPIVLQDIPIPEIDKNTLNLINRLVTEIINTKGQVYELNLCSNEYINILEDYMNQQDFLIENEIKVLKLQNEINEIFYNLYNLSQEERLLIDEVYSSIIERDYLTGSVKDISVHEFINFVNSRKSIKKISLDNDISLNVLLNHRKRYRSILKDDAWRLYNLEYLYKQTDNVIVSKVKEVLQLNKSYMGLSDIRDNLLDNNNPHLSEIIKLYKLNKMTESNETILRRIITGNSITINNFLKKRQQLDMGNYIIKYDNTIFGLTNWSDEVHKKYFVDLIDYLTSSSQKKHDATTFEVVTKTRNKAQSALNALKELNINDKEDYIELLTEKIRKTFE